LLFYSYSQIDLNLTLSSNSLYQKIQNALIWFGYYQRPYSSLIFIAILIFLTGFYRVFLRQSQLRIKYLFLLLSVLVFAYPLLSHDIFNYIFDTRILLHYGLNPWTHKALDFPGDTWVRFMHWTHRNYPYGPSWLLVSIPFYLFGLGKFSLTFLSFKLSSFIFYCLTVWALYKFTKDKNTVAFYAFHPLVLLDFLVSAHNDMVMMFFALFSFLLLKQKKYILSSVILILSIGVKYVSVVFLPVWFYGFYMSIRNNKLEYDKLMAINFWLSVLVVVLVSIKREFQSWYLLWPLVFAALNPKSSWSKILSWFAVSVMFLYVPFIYFGEWQKPIANIKTIIVVVSFLVPVLVFAFLKIIKNFSLKNA